MKDLSKMVDKLWDRYFREAHPSDNFDTFFARDLLAVRNEALTKAAAIARAGIDPEFIAKQIEELMK